jgi:predicted kinase
MRCATIVCVDLVLLCGLQASGKSTFRRARFPNHVVVSKDLMPNARRKEKRQRSLITEALAAGDDVVVDNTNPTAEERASILEVGRLFGARLLGYFFESDFEQCVRRNATRTGRDLVPDVSLRSTRARLVLPSLDEGFDELSFVRLAGAGAFVVTPWPVGTAADG